MSAPFRTAQELRVRPWELEGLVKTLALLESGSVTLPDQIGSMHPECSAGTPSKFYMNSSVARFDCGTALCLGGWCYALGRLGHNPEGQEVLTADEARDIDDYVFCDKSEALGSLYFPPWHDRVITPARGAAVLRKFLESGEIDWSTGP